MNIARPWLALCITFGVAVVLSKYGVVEGTMLLVALVVGILIYKMLVRY